MTEIEVVLFIFSASLSSLPLELTEPERRKLSCDALVIRVPYLIITL
jgi:hypothetical protein